MLSRVAIVSLLSSVPAINALVDPDGVVCLSHITLHLTITYSLRQQDQLTKCYEYLGQITRVGMELVECIQV